MLFLNLLYLNLGAAGGLLLSRLRQAELIRTPDPSSGFSLLDRSGVALRADVAALLIGFVSAISWFSASYARRGLQFGARANLPFSLMAHGR